MKTINLGLIGLGTIGTGVVKVLRENSALIEKRIGVSLVIKRIADLDIKRDRGVPVDKSTLTKKDLINSIYMQIGYSKKISENYNIKELEIDEGCKYEIMFEAANTLRMGRDLLYLVSSSGNLKELLEIKKTIDIQKVLSGHFVMLTQHAKANELLANFLMPESSRSAD